MVGCAWKRTALLAVTFVLAGGACSPNGNPVNNGDGPDIPEPPYPSYHEMPSWSIDDQIAYRDWGIVWVGEGGVMEIDEDRAGIWSLDVVAGDAIRVCADGLYPDWSPDGSRLALSIAAQIHTVAADGTWREQLTQSGRNFRPAWSADGAKIAWDRTSGDRPGVWMMSSSGEEKEFLMAGASRPDWDPLGERLLCNAWVDSVHGIFTYDIATGILTEIRVSTGTAAYDVAPQYSPDGSMIAFEVLVPGDRSEVWIMNRDGSDARQVTWQGGAHPSWSPSSLEIVYTRANGESSAPEDGVLWVTDLATGESRQVTYKPEVESGRGIE